MPVVERNGQTMIDQSGDGAVLCTPAQFLEAGHLGGSLTHAEADLLIAHLTRVTGTPSGADANASIHSKRQAIEALLREPSCRAAFPNM